MSYYTPSGRLEFWRWSRDNSCPKCGLSGTGGHLCFHCYEIENKDTASVFEVGQAIGDLISWLFCCKKENNNTYDVER